MLVNLLLPGRVRDISNNLKLYRAEILKNLNIKEHHFAANAETGLKPLLSGYDIREVPTSWINRTTDMGSSSFSILKVAPNYFFVLFRMIWKTWLGRRDFVKKNAATSIANEPIPIDSSVEHETASSIYIAKRARNH